MIDTKNILQAIYSAVDEITELREKDTLGPDVSHFR